jgi:plasmid stabilization system protein ParE
VNCAFTVQARREVSDIVSYYLQEDRRLAVAFVEELDRLLALLVTNPSIGHRVGPIFRRIAVPTFPYYLSYTTDSPHEVIEISVVCHQRRRADYWRDRVEEPATGYGFESVAA